MKAVELLIWLMGGFVSETKKVTLKRFVNTVNFLHLIHYAPVSVFNVYERINGGRTVGCGPIEEGFESKLDLDWLSINNDTSGGIWRY